MTRFNYSNTPEPMQDEAPEGSDTAPTRLTDGTPLVRDNPCPACGAGNRQGAYRCFECGRHFQSLPNRAWRRFRNGWKIDWVADGPIMILEFLAQLVSRR